MSTAVFDHSRHPLQKMRECQNAEIGTFLVVIRVTSTPFFIHFGQ